jgi:hypothetical protein
MPWPGANYSVDARGLPAHGALRDREDVKYRSVDRVWLVAKSLAVAGTSRRWTLIQ